MTDVALSLRSYLQIKIDKEKAEAVKLSRAKNKNGSLSALSCDKSSIVVFHVLGW